MHIRSSQSLMEKTKIMERWYKILPVFEYKAQEMRKAGIHALMSAAAIVGLMTAGCMLADGVYSIRPITRAIHSYEQYECLGGSYCSGSGFFASPQIVSANHIALHVEHTHEKQMSRAQAEVFGSDIRWMENHKNWKVNSYYMDKHENAYIARLEMTAHSQYTPKVAAYIRNRMFDLRGVEFLADIMYTLMGLTFITGFGMTMYSTYRLRLIRNLCGVPTTNCMKNA